ncbi:hypothetical protein ACI2L1_26430 [Streptomyces sp. NPDC019531]|uniref:MmyB family transcriptional regulator n=1 Tax=Streptomyces sp. NPDC019531 TaxID=3365062 RepID=UPI00384E0F86
MFGYSSTTAPARSIPRQVFLDPGARALYSEWQTVAAQRVAPLRVPAGHHHDDRALTSLVGELSLKSEDFGRLWADHQVKECAYGVKRVQHPVAGLLVCTPEPGPETAARLTPPASWASSPAR